MGMCTCGKTNLTLKNTQMKTLYATLFTLLFVGHSHAQGRSKHDELSAGLERVGSSRNDYSQYHNLGRFDYWNSRFDRYWAKYERLFSKDFGDFSARISRSARNISRDRNNWNG